MYSNAHVGALPSVRKSENRYRQLAGNMKEVIWAVDDKAKTIRVDDRVGDMLD